MAQWTFLTNHAHILVCLARDPDLRIREVADLVGVTERAAQRIVADLVEAGFVEIDKEGRRNHYSIRSDLPLRHPVESGTSLGGLLDLLAPAPPRPPARSPRGDRLLPEGRS